MDPTKSTDCIHHQKRGYTLKQQCPFNIHFSSLPKYSPTFSQKSEDDVFTKNLRKNAFAAIKDRLISIKTQAEQTSQNLKDTQLTLECDIFDDRENGMNLLHVALEEDKMKSVDYMLENCSLGYLLKTHTNIANQIPASEKSCLHIIAEKVLRLFSCCNIHEGNEEFLEKLLSRMKELTSFQKSEFINRFVAIVISEDEKRKVSSVHLAVYHGHNHLLKFMNKENFNMNAEDDFAETPLMWAIRKDKHPEFDELLSNGTDINYINYYKCSPIHVAVEFKRQKMAEKLVDNVKTDLNVKRIKHPQHVVELVASFDDYELMEKLLNAKNKNRINSENIKKALFIAIKSGFTRTANEILKVDKSLVNIMDKKGNTSVLIAANKDQVEIVKLLIETYNADIEVENNFKETIYDMAMKQSKSDLLKYLIHKLTKREVEYLHLAAARADVNKMKLILENDKAKLLDFDENNSHNTIFHTAAVYNASAVLDHFLRKDDDFINLWNKEQDTPLHLAVRNGHLKSFNVLMDKKARVDVENNANQNVLHLAISSTKSNPEIVKKIVKKMELVSYDLNSQDCNGDTALHLAAKFSKAEFIELLSNLNPKIKNKNGETALHSAVSHGTIKEVEKIIKIFRNSKMLNIDHKDKQGRSALFISAEIGNIEMFEFLLKNGADIRLRNSEGCTLLHKIIEKNQSNLNHSRKYIEIFNKFVLWSGEWYCKKFNKIPCSIKLNEYRCKVIRCLTTNWYYKKYNVLQYAAKLGTGDLLKSILTTSNVYKFTFESPLKAMKEQNNEPQDDEILSLLDFFQMGKHNDILYDVSYLIPATSTFEQNKNKADANSNDVDLDLQDDKVIGSNHQPDRSDGNRNQQISCLELIEQAKDNDYIISILEDEPFKSLVSYYWKFCRRVYEMFMWVHVVHMILFTYFMTPSKEYLFHRFDQTKNNNKMLEDRNAKYNSIYAMLMIWPTLIFIYEIIVCTYFILSIKYQLKIWLEKQVEILKCKKTSTLKKLKRLRSNLPKISNEETSGLMKIPFGIMHFISNNLTHISSLIFCSVTTAWYFMARFADNQQNYMECLAVVFIFGWLHTINYLYVFKNWNAMGSIVARIVFKDIIRFLYIYLFVFLSFGYAIYVLNQAVSQDSTSVYLSLYRMIFINKVTNISGITEENNLGNRIYMLRIVYAVFTILSTVILMTLLTAMMNKTYSEISRGELIPWQIDIMKRGLWFGRMSKTIFNFNIILKVFMNDVFYDRVERRWMMVVNKDESFLDFLDQEGKQNHPDTTRAYEITEVETKIENMQKELAEMKAEMIKFYRLCIESKTTETKREACFEK